MNRLLNWLNHAVCMLAVLLYISNSQHHVVTSWTPTTIFHGYNSRTTTSSSCKEGELSSTSSRRFFLKHITVTTVGSVLVANGVSSIMIPPQVANAADDDTVATGTSSNIPMISADEFNIVLRDSARSIDIVEFSGPKSETVIVKLVDGTKFGIRDIIESSTDPRSPLKIAAACRENKVPARFLTYELALKNAPKKQKAYTNARVQEAAVKEREKQERIRIDEENRLRELGQFVEPSPIEQ